MRRIMTHRKKDGTEYKYKVQLEAAEKAENLLAEEKNKKYPKEGGGYVEKTEKIIKFIEDTGVNHRDYVTENKSGGYTRVVVRTGTQDDPNQKWITSVMSEGKGDNLLELESYD